MPEDRVPEELAKLQKKLYRRDISFPETRSDLSPLEINPQSTNWRRDSVGNNFMPTKTPKHFPAVKFIFIVSLIFFIGAIALAAFYYFQGLNVVSGTNIDLSVDGPEKVNAGEVLQISVAIANRNQKNIEEVQLSAVFPSGTKEAENPTKTLRELRESVGTIASGQASIKTFKALVYGEEGQQKTIELALQYRIAGSNATFTKKGTYDFTIGSSPVRVVAVLPEEVNSGQPISLNIQASANAQTALADLAIMVSYPPGFTFVSAEPSPTNSTNVWSLASLTAGQTRQIKINGKIEGQNDDVKSFQIHAGTLAEPTDQELAVEYNTLFKTVTLRRPFVDLKVLVAGTDQTENSVDSEKVIPVTVEWTNTLPIEIRDGKIEVVLNGEVLNEAAVTTSGGNYNSESNTITWGKNDAALGSIGSGERARVDFTLATKSLIKGSGANLSRPQIDLQIKFTGVRASGEDASTPIEVETTKVLKVNTVAQFLSHGLYHTGSFAKTGPMPPKVGQETLYTIEWIASNSTNDIKEAKIKAVVPAGLRFVGSVVPSGENVTFNPSDRTVTWDLQTIKAAGSVGGGRRDVSFQVGLTPSANQVGLSVPLLTRAVFSGIDTFTQKVLNIEARDVDMRLFDDQLFNIVTESVVVP